MAVPYPTSPRARVVQRLLWTSIALSIIIFGLSMVLLGIGSLFVSPAVSGATLIYIITLLALSAKEKRETRELQQEQQRQFELRRTSSVHKLPLEPNSKTLDVDGKSNLPGLLSTTTPAITGASPSFPSSSSAKLPHVFRLPSIVFAFIYVLLSLAALGMLIAFTALWHIWERPKSEFPKIASSIIEAIAIAAQIGVLLAFGILCAKERKVLLATRDQGKRISV